METQRIDMEEMTGRNITQGLSKKMRIKEVIVELHSQGRSSHYVLKSAHKRFKRTKKAS